MKVYKKYIFAIIFIYYLIDFYNFDPYINLNNTPPILNNTNRVFKSNIYSPIKVIDKLTVYKSPFTKIRLGKDYDGGYILADINSINYSILISAGIKDDISFEEDFINKYNSKVIAYDGTINKLPKLSNIMFINKNININSNNLYNLISENGYRRI